MRKDGGLTIPTAFAIPTCCSCSKKIIQKQKLVQQEMG